MTELRFLGDSFDVQVEGGGRSVRMDCGRSSSSNIGGVASSGPFTSGSAVRASSELVLGVRLIEAIGGSTVGDGLVGASFIDATCARSDALDELSGCAVGAGRTDLLLFGWYEDRLRYGDFVNTSLFSCV